MTQEFYACACTFKDGKLKLFNREAFERACGDFPDGFDGELVIQPVKRARTSAQNRFFHGPICKSFLDADLGYRTVQEVKDMLALMFIPLDIKLPDGSIARVPGHTSSLSVKAFNEFIEQCIQLAAENDIFIMDSDDWRKKQGAA